MIRCNSILRLAFGAASLILAGFAGCAGPPHPQLSLPLAHDQKLEFIWIEPGQFVMGAPDSDKLAEAYEKPQHEVRIGQGFYLGRTTVTLGQFRQFVLETGYKTDAETDQRPRYRGAHGYNATRHRFEEYYPQY